MLPVVRIWRKHALYYFVQELPAPILDDVAFHKPVEHPKQSYEPQDSLDAMKIAWRYQNLPKVQVTTLVCDVPPRLLIFIAAFFNAIYSEIEVTLW